jgi:uncharacterized protein YciI
MPLFAVIGFDDTPRSAALREANRAEHRAYAKANDEPTRLAGAFYGEDGNQCGTLKIFEADSAEEVWAWYRKEPFYKAGVYKDFYVVEWKLALNRFEPRDWDPNFPTKK